MSDPFDTQPVGSNIVIEFYAYGDFIPYDAVSRVLQKATTESLSYKADDPIETQPLEYWASNAQLVFVPREGITWRIWFRALKGIRDAFRDHAMNFEWHFAIAMTGKPDGRQLGYGMLTGPSHQTSTARRKG